MARLNHPHSRQKEILKDQHKFVVVVCGRRFGKTYSGILSALKTCLDFPQWIARRGHPELKLDRSSPFVVGIIMPTQQMARQIYWKPLCDILSGLPEVDSINRSQMLVRFHGDRPDLLIKGANDANGDRLRGLKFVKVICDEFQDFKRGVLDTVIAPAMADTPGSQGLILGTPKGRLNHYFEIAQRSLEFPDSYRYHHYLTSDNPYVPSDEIARAKLMLPPRLYRQEFEASFEDFEGKIFSELGEVNRCDRAPSAFELTIMGIDWGETSPAFVVWGLKDGVWYWCEGWQPNGSQPVPQPIQDSHIVRLAGKWSVKAAYCDPSRPSAILGVRALGKNNNMPGLVRATAGNNRVDEGINWLHGLVYQQRLSFPKQTVGQAQDCIHGSEAYLKFEAYHRKTDKEGRVTEEVAPNQDDHIIDASRYALFSAK